MNPQKHIAILLGLLVSGLAAAEPAAADASAATFTDDQKHLLKALDDSLVRFDALLARDTDVEHHAMIGAFVNGFKEHNPAIREDDTLLHLLTGVNWPNGFKQRAAALHQPPFDQGKYDELKMDIDVQYQREVVWLTPPKTLPRSTGVPQLSLTQLNPSPTNTAEVKAALAALDLKVRHLEEKTSALPAGAVREADTARLRGIKNERAELARNFTKQRWDAVVGEIALIK